MKPRKTGPKRSGSASKRTLNSGKTLAGKKGSRPRAKRKTKEQSLHMNGVQWFRATFPGVLAFHVPNGEKRDRRTAEKLKRMGVLAGVPDWLMFPDGVKVAMEFKTDEGEQSPEQQRFERMWKRAGGTYLVVRSLDDFKALCVGYCYREVPSVPWLRDSNPSAANLAV
jgi:hypothetical protein